MIKLVLLFFVAAYLAPMTVLMGDYNFEPIFFLLASITMAVFAAFIVTTANDSDGHGAQAVDHATLYAAPLFLMYVSMLLYLPLKVASITSLLQGLADGNLTEIMAENAAARYAVDAVGPSLADQLGLMVLFMFFIFWGSRSGLKGRKHRYIFVLFAGFAFMVESIALARAGILLAMLAFFVEFVIRRNAYLYRISSFAYIKYSVPIAALLFGVYFFSAYLRVYGNDNAAEIALNKLAAYTIAPHELFLIWMQEHYVPGPTGGVNTFTFIWKFFGLEVEQGYYGPLMTRFGISNIYMNLRGLVQDFGSLGACLFIGWMSAQIAYSTFTQLGAVSYTFLRIALVIILFPIYSPFLFTVFAVAFLFAGGVLVVLKPAHYSPENDDI